MNEKYFEETIAQIYEHVDNAKGVAFSQDKCMVDRNLILNLLDELNERLPSELKKARMMLDSQDELQTVAKRKAEMILKDAHEKQKKMISEHEIYVEAKAQANEMVRAAQTKIAEMRKAAVEFVDESLRVTEETIAQSLSDVRDTRSKFRTIKGASNKNTAIIEDV